MKLHLTPGAGLQLFSGYGAGYVAVNHVRYESGVDDLHCGLTSGR